MLNEINQIKICTFSDIALLGYVPDNLFICFCYLQSIVTIGVGILSSIQLNKSRDKLQENAIVRKNKAQHNKMERRLYITVVMMQAGFTVTLSKCHDNYCFYYHFFAFN